MSKQSKRESVVKSGMGGKTPGETVTTPKEGEVLQGEEVEPKKVSQKPSLMQVDEPTELENKLMKAGKISAFILAPIDIRRIFNSPRMKEELVKFLQELYKPKS